MVQLQLTPWLNQWRCTIQRGESPLFTLCIYSLCCEIVCWDRRAFSSLGQALCCPSVSQAGQVSVLWGWGRQCEKQHTLIPMLLEPVFLPWNILIVMPQGFTLSDSAPKQHSAGAGPGLVFRVFCQHYPTHCPSRYLLVWVNAAVA